MSTSIYRGAPLPAGFGKGAARRKAAAPAPATATAKPQDKPETIGEPKATEAKAEGGK